MATCASTSLFTGHSRPSYRSQERSISASHGGTLACHRIANSRLSSPMFASVSYDGVSCGESWQGSRKVSRRSSSTVKVDGRRGRGNRHSMRVRAISEEQIASHTEGEWGVLPMVMIAGAPASGKGTQCEMIVDKFGVSHISTGDLLRAEVAAGSESGSTAKDYMDAGKLVPNEIVVGMVETKLAQCESGWLLDGFPRSLDQAEALEAINVRPRIFILLDVPDDVLIERVVGRRLDPVTGKVYHLKFFPPETEEIASRLQQRSDDTEEKAKTRLQTYHANVGAVVGVYKDIIKRVDGNRPKKEVFDDIAKLLGDLKEKTTGGEPRVDLEQLAQTTGVGAAAIAVKKEKKREGLWSGVPTKLNTIPHSREIRNYLYADVCNAAKNAVEDGLLKLKVHMMHPELNPDMDTFRIGTLLEMVRELAFAFAIDGKRVRVCVQGSMGAGISAGLPLQLSGVKQLLNRMDWGDCGQDGTFIRIGAVGPQEVKPDDDIFILVAPQNSQGNCIIENLQGMVAAAGDRPVIIVNPSLKDLPSAGGVMQVMGRDKRMEVADSFTPCYHFRLLYQSGTFYPILGALRMAYPSPYQIYKRIDTVAEDRHRAKSKEAYVLLRDTYEKEPSSSEIGDAYYGRKKSEPANGIWGVLARILG